MLRRIIPLFAACGLLALGGYQVSFWRAGLDAPVQEALAAAGAPGSLLSSGETTEFDAVFVADYQRGYQLSGDLVGRLALAEVP